MKKEPKPFLNRLFCLMIILLMPGCASNTQSITATTFPELPTATIGYQTFTPQPSQTPVSLPNPYLLLTPTPSQTLALQAIPEKPSAQATLVFPVAQIPNAKCIPAQEPETADVVEILDGVTIRVLMGNQVFTVRYLGVQAPGDVLVYGPPATLENAKLVYGKTVRLYKDTTNMDGNGMLLRYVIADNAFVNYQLVTGGFVSALETPPDIACSTTLEAAQTGAQQAVIGMWAPTLTPGLPPRKVCDCDKDRYNCTRQFFYTQSQAQACFNYCNLIGAGDIHGLDRDGNGIACDSFLR